MRFGLLEAKLGIAKAVQVVEFQKCEKTEVRNDIFHIIVLSSIYSLDSASIGKTNISECEE